MKKPVLIGILLFAALIGLIVFILFNLVNTGPYNAHQLAFSDFLNQVKAHKVTEVTLRGEEVSGTLEDKTQFQTYIPDVPNLVSTLMENGVKVRSESPNQSGLFFAQ